MSKVRALIVGSMVVMVGAGCAKSESSPSAASAVEPPGAQAPAQPPMPRSEAVASQAATAGPAPTPPSEGPEKDYVSGDVTVTEVAGAKNDATKPSPAAAAKASSALAPDTIRRVVRNANAKFLACYQAALQKNPTLAGRVTVKFTIDKNGAPKAVTVAGGDLTDKSVGQCLTKAVASLTFPQPDRGEVLVSYPFAFTPADAQATAGTSVK
ncbi:MAG: AgmX/PglI C-terminal domain-containing protein [Polyangiaceae bacterium]